MDGHGGEPDQATSRARTSEIMIDPLAITVSSSIVPFIFLDVLAIAYFIWVQITTNRCKSMLRFKHKFVWSTLLTAICITISNVFWTWYSFVFYEILFTVKGLFLLLTVVFHSIAIFQRTKPILQSNSESLKYLRSLLSLIMFFGIVTLGFLLAGQDQLANFVAGSVAILAAVLDLYGTRIFYKCRQEQKKLLKAQRFVLSTAKFALISKVGVIICSMTFTGSIMFIFFLVIRQVGSIDSYTARFLGFVAENILRWVLSIAAVLWMYLKVHLDKMASSSPEINMKSGASKHGVVSRLVRKETSPPQNSISNDIELPSESLMTRTTHNHIKEPLL
jgi:hypothetical protein